LEITLKPDAKLGGTEIFVSADRYYPAGFRLEIGAWPGDGLETRRQALGHRQKRQ
jgi:hypothetical protein